MDFASQHILKQMHQGVVPDRVEFDVCNCLVFLAPLSLSLCSGEVRTIATFVYMKSKVSKDNI